MSLSKIPFIIASTVGVHCSTISPSQPPSSEDKVLLSAASESFVRWCLRLYALEILRTLAWTASFAEVASIIATRVDPSQIPGVYDARAVQLFRSSLHPTPITPAFLAGSLALAVGGMLRLYCSSTLGKFWSFQLSVRKGHRLVTRGPYSVVRHPSYAAYLIQYVGLIAMSGSQGSWIRDSGVLHMRFAKVLAAIYFFLFTAGVCTGIRRVPLEDEMLHNALGEEWESWAKRVKYRLVPGVY